VLGNGRLGDPELVADDGRHGACGLFAVGQQLEDPASDRVSENVERVHVQQYRS
jgi:hypothetical protein